MRKKEIVILGHVCIDRDKAEKIYYVAAGGSATFMARVCNQLSCQTKIISPYGRDFLKYSSLSMVAQPSYRPRTLVYENIIKGKSRLQKVYHSKDAHPAEITEKAQKAIKTADIVFVAPLLQNFSVSYVSEAIGYAKKGAVKILLPQGYFRSVNSRKEIVKRKFVEANKILPLFDFTIVSDEDFPHIKELARVWTKRGKTKIIITLGEKGVLIIEKNKETMVPTTPVAQDKIVDSVGSGDIFGAGFAFEYARTKNVIYAAEFGNIETGIGSR